MSSIVNLFFGAVLGVMWGLPRLSIYQGREYRLHQDWQFRQLALGSGWVLLLLLVIWFTDLRFQWVYFVGALLGVGTLGHLILGTALRGNFRSRWAIALRSLYNDESYRNSDYSPRMNGPIVDFFDPHATEFSLPNALVCAHLSRTAYFPEDKVKAAAKDWGCSVDFFESANHAAIMVSSPAAVIVAFRGTDDFQDWLTNLSIWHRTPWGPTWGSIHSGFLSAVDALWPQVQRAIHKRHARIQKLWFTGHSLGGAMAVVAAAKLAAEAKDVEASGIYTFGQPAVGDRTFCKAFDSRVKGKLVRFETPGDDVPKQPSGWPHAGGLQYFDRFGCLHTQPGYFKKFADQLRRDSLGLIGEHKILNYLRLVECAFVEDVIQGSEAALRVYSETDTPKEWAMAQNNLAVAYRKLPTGDPANNLKQAIQAWRAALRVYTEKKFPTEWAFVLFSIGSAYFDLPTDDRQQNLQNAIEAWEASLRVHTEVDFPDEWARAQSNLGLAYHKLVVGDPDENIRKAIQAFEECLHVYTEKERPTHWSTTQFVLGETYYQRLPKNDLNLSKAKTCFENALRVITEESFPPDYGLISKRLAEVKADLAASTAK